MIAEDSTIEQLMAERDALLAKLRNAHEQLGYMANDLNSATTERDRLRELLNLHVS